MPSIPEFLELLSTDVEKAFRSYFLNIDGSLDGNIEISQHCRIRKVCFEFIDPNIILMRDPGSNPTEYPDEIWYLPWRHRGASKADLDGSGPAFFSTSQLDGCRFTIQYHDTSRKNVTVYHLAGNVDGGSKGRDQLEAKAGVKSGLPSGRTRRYSVSSGAKSFSEKVGEDFSLKYDGDKASIFGIRDDDGAWHFFAQQMREPRSGEPHLPPLGGKAKGLRELTAE